MSKKTSQYIFAAQIVYFVKTLIVMLCRSLMMICMQSEGFMPLLKESEQLKLLVQLG